METKEINWDEIFKMFCQVDPDKEYDISKPFKQGDKLYATDRFSLIMVNAADVELSYSEMNSIKVDSVIQKERTQMIRIGIEDLERRLVPVMIPEEEEVESECDACDGEGEVEFEFSHGTKSYEMDGQCPVCDGEGTITEGTPTGKDIPNPYANYKLFGSGFKYHLLSRLVSACKMMGVSEITKIYGDGRKQSVFICGIATILIMPCLVEAEDEFIEIELTPLKTNN